MRISELMTTDVITVGPETPLKEAARRMLQAGISGLPVTSDEGELLGIITEADFVKTEANRGVRKRAGLLRWFVNEGGMPSHSRVVGDVMSRPVLTVGPDDKHPEAARLLTRNNIKRLPVVDDGRLVGLVSRTDLLRSFVRPDKAIVDEVTDEVMRRVLWIDPGRVSVSCHEGDVSLSGHLETRADAELLVSLTERLDGVASVESQLTWEIDNTKLEATGPSGVPFLSRSR